MAKSTKSLSDAVSKEIKSKFSLGNFKDKKGLSSNVKFKEQQYIKFSPAVQKALTIEGICTGQVNVVRGFSDSGKTTLLIEVAVEAQKMGILPVIIITEMKNDMGHWKNMGFELTETRDSDNDDNVTYEGQFLYVDRSSINCIEDISEFILDILDEQKKGNLPYDLLFLWDSVGSLPCKMSIEQNKNSPMWNAGAMATQFGNFVNQRFPMSRKADQPYTNTLFVVNKTGVQPALTPMSQPRMTNKNGDTMYWDAALVVTFGNVTNSGTSKLKATKNGKSVDWAKRTKIAVDKYHLKEGWTTKSTVIMTPNGFIEDTPASVDKYKKQYAKTWFKDIKDISELKFEEDFSEWDESGNISELLESINEKETEFDTEE